jgi:ABC-type multidrug transport system ATPase subunit
MPYKKEATLLKATNLSKSYGNKLVIRDVSMEIKNITRPGLLQGQVIGLIGRSGIGKSTLFRMLAGLEKPSGGEIKVFNEQLLNKAASAPPETPVDPYGHLVPVHEGDMGVVFQNYIMFDDLTVRGNFREALRHRPDASKVNAKAFIDAYAGEFNLTEHLEKYPCQLSGGQQQRAAIIVQLLNGSKFLLLDEPLSGLDAIMIEKMTNLLVKVSLQDELQTIVIVSHDLENALAICDTAFVIGTEEGKEGAILKAEIDLMERGLAWNPEVKEMPVFRQTLREVKAML